MTRVGLIGFGAIGRSIVASWRQHSLPHLSLVAIYTRSPPAHDLKDLVPNGTILTNDFERFVALDLDLVIEAAGQNCIADLGVRILESGVNLYVLSIGALADPSIREKLFSAATASRILLPSGALGGFDALRSLRQSGLTSVTYTSTKPPQAWRRTEAETMFDPDALNHRIVFFEGTAEDAALRFPQNANLAAAVALAGVGFKNTAVKLIADPDATGNIGEIEATGAYAKFHLTMSGSGFAENPKSSAITGLSVLAALENASSVISFV